MTPRFIKPLFVILLFAGLIASCNQPDETENREVKRDTALISDTISLKSYSQEFQNIVQNSQGVFRGVELGLGKDQVRKKEEAFPSSELQEETPQYLDYMINMGVLENTDLRYHLNERGNVSMIEVNIYPNSKPSQDSIFAEFQTYFSGIYGAGKELSPGYMKWEMKEKNLAIEMQKRGTQKVHDINIIFSDLSRKSAGVLYQPLPEGL